ncbi:MAG: hypothetical protein AAB654_00430, partial [Acidobacteriota bacterium]
MKDVPPPAVETDQRLLPGRFHQAGRKPLPVVSLEQFAEVAQAATSDEICTRHPVFGGSGRPNQFSDPFFRRLAETSDRLVVD